MCLCYEAEEFMPSSIQNVDYEHYDGVSSFIYRLPFIICFIIIIIIINIMTVGFFFFSNTQNTEHAETSSYGTYYVLHL